MLRPSCLVLANLLVLGSIAPRWLRAEEPEPLAVLTDFADFGESLLVAPATEAEQLDAAERLNREFGPDGAGGQVPSGRWKISPHLETRVTFDDNIFIQPENEVEDFIFTLAPGVAVGIWDSEKRRTDGFLDREEAAGGLDKGRGSYFAIDCTAILLGFAKTDSQNAFDQNARLDARWQAERWTLGGGVHYESKSETNTDIGTRIRRQTVSAEVVASYRVSDKTALDASVSVRANDPEDYVRSTGWKVESSAAYELTPLVHVGLGGAVGGVAIEGGADDIFQRILARAAYACSEKLEVEVRGGVEFRQSDGPAGDRVNPIFGVLASYAPSAGTRLGLEVFRSVETSEFRPEESYERTGFTATFRRALRAGLHLGLDGGWRESDYSGPAQTGRRDDYFFVRPRLTYHFADWGNAGVIYEFRRNDSSRADSSFDNSQVSFQVLILY